MNSIFSRIRERNYRIYNQHRIVLLVLWPLSILAGVVVMARGKTNDFSGLIMLVVGIVLGVIWFTIYRFKHVQKNT
jgi:hypothetical protein